MRDIWLEGDGGLLSMEEALGDSEPMPELVMDSINEEPDFCEGEAVKSVCERCGFGFIKKDESDVCGVCLDEIDLEHQYEVYRLACALKRVPAADYDIWADADE